MVQLQLPERIEAEFKIITPMFIGDGRQNAEMVYPQSVKGALRFWWRALMWSDYLQKTSDEVEALKALHYEESRLFGGTAEQEQPASIAVKVIAKTCKVTDKGDIHPLLAMKTAARYLGYGVVEAFNSRAGNSVAGKLTRSCLDPNQHFTLELTSKSEKDLKSVMPAIKLFGLLGGLGSKARKGYGSVQLMSLTYMNSIGEEKSQWTTPTTTEEYQKELALLLSSTANELLPPFTAFSKKSLIIQTVKDGDPYEVLNQYGQKMMHYRSWGKDGIVLGGSSERNFKKDHDWSKGRQLFEKEFPQLSFRTFHPERAVFGLPHSYGKSLHVGRVLKKGSGHNSKDKVGRRASPLFFHVHCLADNNFIGISTFLPAQFLPKDEKISAGGMEVSQDIQWDIISTKFLLDKARFPKSHIVFSGSKVKE